MIGALAAPLASAAPAAAADPPALGRISAAAAAARAAQKAPATAPATPAPAPAARPGGAAASPAVTPHLPAGPSTPAARVGSKPAPATAGEATNQGAPAPSTPAAAAATPAAAPAATPAATPAPTPAGQPVAPAIPLGRAAANSQVTAAARRELATAKESLRRAASEYNAINAQYTELVESGPPGVVRDVFSFGSASRKWARQLASVQALRDRAREVLDGHRNAFVTAKAALDEAENPSHGVEVPGGRIVGGPGVRVVDRRTAPAERPEPVPAAATPATTPAPTPARTAQATKQEPAALPVRVEATTPAAAQPALAKTTAPAPAATTPARRAVDPLHEDRIAEANQHLSSLRGANDPRAAIAAFKQASKEYKAASFNEKKPRDGGGTTEDAVSMAPEKGLFAISDGVTNSSYSTWMSRALVRQWTERPPSSTKELGTTWLADVQKEWAEKTAELPGRNAWYNTNTIGHATFVGAKLVDDELKVMGIGDSMIFLVRDGKLVKAFPLSESAQFSNVVPTLPSKGAFVTRAATATDPEIKLTAASWKVRAGDEVFMTTDALGHWVFSQLEGGKNPFESLRGVQTKAEWSTFVGTARDKLGMHLDDTALVRFVVPNHQAKPN